MGFAAFPAPGNEGAPRMGFAAFPAPRALHGICVGAGPLSLTEPGENQALAAVPRAGSAPRISSRSGFAKGTVTRIACLEQTSWFFPGKPRSRASGWGRSMWAPRRPAALGRACPVPRSAWGQAGHAGVRAVSEEGTALAAPDVVSEQSRSEGGLRSQPAPVPARFCTGCRQSARNPAGCAGRGCLGS